MCNETSKEMDRIICELSDISRQVRSIADGMTAKLERDRKEFVPAVARKSDLRREISTRILSGVVGIPVLSQEALRMMADELSEDILSAIDERYISLAGLED